MHKDEPRRERPEEEQPNRPTFERGMEDEEGESRNIESQVSEVGISQDETFDDDLNPVDLYEKRQSER